MGRYQRSLDQNLVIVGHTLSTLGFICFTVAKLTRLFIEDDLPSEAIFTTSKHPTVEDIVEKSFHDNPDAFRW